MQAMFIAHFNFARLKIALDDQSLNDFLRGRGSIRRIAERCDGFIWKQEAGAGEAGVENDPSMLLSLSVWRSPEALRHFAWNTLHQRFWARRSEWFERMTAPTFAMWWVLPDHRPDHAEAWARIEHLRTHGETDQAFGWNFLSDQRNRTITAIAAE